MTVTGEIQGIWSIQIRQFIVQKTVDEPLLYSRSHTVGIFSHGSVGGVILCWKEKLPKIDKKRGWKRIFGGKSNERTLDLVPLFSGRTWTTLGPRTLGFCKAPHKVIKLYGSIFLKWLWHMMIWWLWNIHEDPSKSTESNPQTSAVPPFVEESTLRSTIAQAQSILVTEIEREKIGCDMTCYSPTSRFSEKTGSTWYVYI